MRTLLDLADSLDKLVGIVPEQANEVTKTVARAIITNLAEVTPADTGAAISNWQVSISLPNASILPPYAPSPPGKMVKGVWTHTVDPTVTRAANAPITIEEAFKRIAARRYGEVIFIVSVLPYISVLDEHGTSKQAPAGFVDRAMILGREISKQAVVEKIKLL